MTPASEHDDLPADPAAMADLMRDQRRRTRRWELRPYVAMLVVWAVSWAVGFTCLWSSDADGGNPWFRMPATAAAIVFIVLMAVAIVVSIVAGIRSGVGVRGPSRLAGALYGWSWTISMLGAGALLGAVGRAGMPTETMNILAPGLFVLLVGVLYLAGGALWRAPVQYALGVVMIATALGASFAGSPTHYLVYATVGPVAMLVVAALMARGVLPSEGSAR
jgi:hypothetical protein